MPPPSTPMRRSVAALAVTTLGLVGLAAVPAQATLDDDTGVVTVDLLGINDFHGRIEAEERVPGAQRLATKVEEIRAENEDTLFLAAGDNFGGSTFTTLINDENPAVQVLDAMELDASSLGNHEFDKGVDVLQERIAGTGDYSGENQVGWPYLGANVEGAEPPFEGNMIITTENNVDVGVIGMVTPTVPTLVSPAGIEGLTFTDMADTATAQVAEVEAAGAEIVVILVHEGAPNGDAVHDYDNDFGRLVETSADLGVTAIFSGHTHQKYDEWVDGEDGHQMAVLQSGSYTANLGQVTVEYDPAEDEILEVEKRMIPLEDVEVAKENDVVQQIGRIIEAAQAEAEERGRVVVGQIGADLNRAVKPDESENRGGESTIGNLIADIQLSVVTDMGATDIPPEIAFMNPGGIRGDLTYDADIDGDVTFRQVATMQPFGNTLESFQLTDAQIVEALEQQWQPSGSRRPHLKLGISERLNYFFDPEAQEGEHIIEVLFDGDPIDEDATYQVVANNFLAAGGDSFFALGEGTGYTDTGMSDLEAFVEYFETMGEAGEPVLPSYIQRSIGAHWVTSEEDGDEEEADEARAEDEPYELGEVIELDLSSIVFTTTEPRPEALDLELVNPETDDVIDVGTAEITDEVLELTDETGIAHVRVAVPEIGCSPEPEMWRLRAIDSVNEYAVWFDVVLAAQETECDDDGDGDGEEPTTPGEEPTSADEEPTTLHEGPSTPGEGPSTPGDGGSGTPGGDLPRTGAGMTAPLVGGALLLTLGGLLLASRRRTGSLT